jgi:hypothetical protein
MLFCLLNFELRRGRRFELSGRREARARRIPQAWRFELKGEA